MGFTFLQVVVSDVDNVAADRLCWHQSQIVVFRPTINAKVCLVDGSLINGIWYRFVDKFTAKKMHKTLECV